MSVTYTVTPDGAEFSGDVPTAATAAHFHAARAAAGSRIPHAVVFPGGTCGFRRSDVTRPNSIIAQVRDAGISAWWCFATRMWWSLDEMSVSSRRQEKETA